jgi:hypothetical protein
MTDNEQAVHFDCGSVVVIPGREEMDSMRFFRAARW